MGIKIDSDFFEKWVDCNEISLYGNIFKKTSDYTTEVDDYFKVGIKNYRVVYFKNGEIGEIKFSLNNVIGTGLRLIPECEVEFNLRPEYETKLPYPLLVTDIYSILNN